MRYLLLEERQHSWHSHPWSPGMDPGMFGSGAGGSAPGGQVPCWMGLLTLRCTITHPPGSPSLPLSLAHGPSQGCAVISLHQDTASPVLCLSSVLGSELFHQRKTEDLGQSCHSQSFSSPHLPHFVCWEAPLCFFSTFFGISAKPSGTNL